MMPEFKIEDNIPLPTPSVSELEPEEQEVEDIEPPEDTRWVPFKPHKRKCRNEEHWPKVGRCERCGDIFPCPSGNCGHFDCADPSLAGLDCKGNGTELPEFINVISAENFMARTECGTITISQEDESQEPLA